MDILIYLIAAHILCDFPLQGDWLARTKNPSSEKLDGESIWFSSLIYHSMLHAAAVYFITSNAILFWVELVLHFVIDYAKCKKLFGYNFDQTLHILCKIAYATLIMKGITA